MKNMRHVLIYQSGTVLVISLIMLLLLTLIGLTGMQTTGLEEKMAGNSRDRNRAFQAAESTLLEAEKFVLANSPDTTYTGSGGLLDIADSEPDFFTSSTWTGNNSTETDSGFGANFGLSSEPRYIIKRIYQNGGTNTNVFRITVRAIGKSPGTQVILQEIYERTN